MANTPINLVKQRTPHAAVLIWNYEDRLGVEDTPIEEVNSVKEVILSTISLVSINTKKTKGEPVGRFEINLAPTKNWVSEITSGSWMVIMMGQNPITRADIANCNPSLVKFFGKIESVRFNNYIIDPESGARGSGYTITGVDWAHIFENNVYIDPFIEKENNTLGSTTYIDLFEKVINVDNRSSIVTVRDNLANIIKVIGQPFSNEIIEQSSVVNRVAKADYSFAVPPQVQTFFGFKDSTNIVDSIELITGKLIEPDVYEEVGEAFGWIDPASLRGINTLWQLLIDNSCPVLNETFTDLMWPPDDDTPVLALYNRIKPFAYRAASETEKRIQQALSKETFGAPPGVTVNQQQQADVVLAQVKNLMSKFQLLKTYDIPLEDIIAFDAGTNWRDKFNFAEIKPGWQNADLLANWIKTVAQTADVKAFQREGFRPLIMSTKQFPTFGKKGTLGGQQNDLGINPNVLAGWKQLLREWYFDTHRLLNGTMTIVGQSEYIQVGSNVRVPFDILGKTHNINQGALNSKDAYLLAHVESVNNSFRVSQDGARNFTTTISFVRGIIVSSNGSLVGEGKTDSKVSAQTSSQYRNTNNVISTSTALNPNPRKNNGT
jgi:hypothetical protein